jgi:hypothetical protein
MLEAEDVTALVEAATTIESTRFNVPEVRTGATITALFTITFALALLTVTAVGLPPKMATRPAPVMLTELKSHRRVVT